MDSNGTTSLRFEMVSPERMSRPRRAGMLPAGSESTISRWKPMKSWTDWIFPSFFEFRR